MSAFVNEWDEVVLCDTCRLKLAELEEARAVVAIAEERGALEQSRSVYFISAEGGPIKIGTAAMPKARLRELQTGIRPTLPSPPSPGSLIYNHKGIGYD